MNDWDPRTPIARGTLETSFGISREILVPVLGICLILSLALTVLAVQPFRQLGMPARIGALEGRLYLDELMPLLVVSLAAARHGTARSAQVASLRQGGQMDALLLLGWRPLPRLLLPAALGTALALMPVTIWASLLSLVTSALAFRLDQGLSMDLFWTEVAGVASRADLVLALCKAAAFGALSGFLSTLAGLRAGPGAEAIARAVTEGLVTTVVAVGAVNLLLTWMWLP